VAPALFFSGCSQQDPVTQARTLIENGQIESAIELLGQAVEAHPEDARLQHHYGSALLQNGKASLAAWPLRRAASDPDHAIESGLLLATALLSGRNPSDAISAADTVLALETDNPQALAIRARARLRNHEEAAAIEDVDRLLEERPDDMALLQLKVEALLRSDRAKEAEELITRLRGLVAELEEPPAGLAERLCGLDAVFTAENGDTDSARELFAGCLESYPNDAIVRAAAVAFFDDQQEFARGNEILEQALERNPKSLAVRGALASRLQAMERTDEAERLLREGAELIATPAAWATLADHYVATENLAAARDAIDSAYRRGDEGESGGVEIAYDQISEQGLFAFGDILVQLGETERVAQIMQHLEEPAHRSFLEARAHYEAGDFEAALATYEEGFRLWPSNPGARYLAAKAALQVGDFDLATSHYRESVRNDAARTDAGLELARMLLAQGNPADAFDAIGHHVRGHPTDAAALRLLANLASQAGNREQLQGARAALSALPGQHALAIADHARDLARVEGTEVASRFITDNVEDLLSAENREILHAWSEILAAEGKHDQVLARVEGAIAAAPEDASLYAARGQALLRAGKPADARTAFARAIELDPMSADALVALARLKSQDGDAPGALALYDAATRAAPDQPLPRYEAAALLIAREPQADSRAEAEKRLRELLADHPIYGKAATALARLAIERGETGDAVVALAERGARFQADPAALETLGQLYLRRGENDPAVQALRWAVELGATEGGTHYELGRALAATGDIDGARSALQLALTKGDFPELDAARLELARLDRTVSEM
jgi:predicted Zn-dependent protease